MTTTTTTTMTAGTPTVHLENSLLLNHKLNDKVKWKSDAATELDAPSGFGKHSPLLQQQQSKMPCCKCREGTSCGKVSSKDCSSFHKNCHEEECGQEKQPLNNTPCVFLSHAGQDEHIKEGLCATTHWFLMQMFCVQVFHEKPRVSFADNPKHPSFCQDLL